MIPIANHRTKVILLYSAKGAGSSLIRVREHLRAYKLEAPEGFAWRRYLELNPDLIRQGVDAEEAAIEYYLGYGIREYRRFV